MCGCVFCVVVGFLFLFWAFSLCEVWCLFEFSLCAWGLLFVFFCFRFFFLFGFLFLGNQ